MIYCFFFCCRDGWAAIAGTEDRSQLGLRSPARETQVKPTGIQVYVHLIAAAAPAGAPTAATDRLAPPCAFGGSRCLL